MRKYDPEILMAAILSVSFLLLCGGKTAAIPKKAPAPVLAAAPTALQEVRRYDEGRTITLLCDGTAQTLSLHDYLIGVLLAELPMDFAPEALKAQAVASRTYALHTEKHGSATVCTGNGCCQTWRAADETTPGYEKAKAAVEETDGLVLKYDGDFIDATFFACSGGTTEAAVAVWGSEVPYLQSVESPGEEQAASYHSQVCLSAADFAEKVTASHPEADLTGDAALWVQNLCRTAGNGVAQAEIGGIVLEGTELRQMFGLRSTSFTLTYADGMFTFEVYGYGHRVGMSQYGAQAMAQAGADFEEILKTYYLGVELCAL